MAQEEHPDSDLTDQHQHPRQNQTQAIPAVPGEVGVSGVHTGGTAVGGPLARWAVGALNVICKERCIEDYSQVCGEGNVSPGCQMFSTLQGSVQESLPLPRYESAVYHKYLIY